MERLLDNAKRLQVSEERLSIEVANGSHFKPKELADAVIVDAPCSGLGTASRHADLVLQLSLERLAAYPSKQLSLLKNAATLVKSRGRIIYSTCSIHPTENEQVIDAFLKQKPNWQCVRQQTWLPNEQGFPHDGFYIARLKLKC